MARLKNRFNVPSIPVFWTNATPKARIEWRTATETFIQWCSKVRAFCDGNQIPYPGDDAMDELACTQFPKSYCNGDSRVRAQATMQRSTGGCSACGHR